MLHHDQPEAVARLIEEFLALMAQFFSIHPTHPQARLVRRAAEIVRGGGADRLSDRLLLRARLPPAATRRAVERLRRVRGMDERHHLTLMCRDLSEIATYAIVDDAQFRPAEERHAGQLHLHPARDARGAAAPGAPAPQDDRRARSRPSGGARAARRARTSRCCRRRCCCPARRSPLSDADADPRRARAPGRPGHRRRLLRHRAEHGDRPHRRRRRACCARAKARSRRSRSRRLTKRV